MTRDEILHGLKCIDGVLSFAEHAIPLLPAKDRDILTRAVLDGRRVKIVLEAEVEAQRRAEEEGDDGR